VCIHGTAPVDYVALIRGDRLLAVERFGEHDLTWEFTDENPLVGEEVPYYVRVAQADGEFAWSSPIWVTCRTRSSRPSPRARSANDLPPWNTEVPLLPESYEHYGPSGYLETLKGILKRRVNGARFTALKEVGVIAGYRGRYVEFTGRDRADAGCPIHIHYYPGFEEEDRLYISRGWSDFGQWRNTGPWQRQ
jgi:hypothetical protein